MKFASKMFARLSLVASAMLFSNSASALWLGLTDGDYDLTLTSCNSSVPGLCATLPLTGVFTVSGSGLSAMDITVDGVSFIGDPADFLQDPFITPGDVRERSSIINSSPFAFISLLHEIGTLGPNLPFTNAYIYCNTVPNGCTPNTVGEWVATRRVVISEPAMGVLLVLGFVGLRVANRRIVNLPTELVARVSTPRSASTF